MAGVSESTVTVVGRSVDADETLMEPLASEGLIEESLCGEDGGEIMVEVVGSDVFVDGVGGQGVAGDWNGEQGGRQLVREDLEREMESADGKGGVISGLTSQELGALGGQVCESRIETRVEGFQEIAGSSYEQTHVAVEEVASMVNEEGLERGEQLVDRGGDASGVLDSHGAGILHDEAQNSESRMGGSLAISGSSREQTEVVVERVVVAVSEEGPDRGSVEEGVEKDMKSVAEVGGALYELPPQRVGVLDDDLWNPGIGAAVVHSPTITQSSSMQTQVVAQGLAMMVNDEFLNHKDEVPGSGAEEGNLTYSENDHCSVAEAVCVGRDKDGEIQSNAESLNQRVEVAVTGEVEVMNMEEILHPRGNLCCSVEDEQMKVETAGENTGSEGDLRADSMSSCEPTVAVAGSEVTKVEDKVSLNPIVGAPKSVGVDAGEVGTVCADSGSSIEQCQVAADYSVANESKMSTSSTVTLAGGGREPLTTEDRVLGASDENPDYVDDQELKVKRVGGGSEKYPVWAESHSSYEQARVVNNNEVSGMDSKISSSEVEIPATDDIDMTVTCSEDDQDKKCETTCAGKDGHVLSDLESSNEQACSRGKDGIAQGNAEASGEQIEIDNRVESSVLECQGTVHVPACYTFDENISLSQKAEELKVETLGKTSVEDPYVGVDSLPIGDRSCHIETCSDSLKDNTSLRDEKHETVAQLADVHSHEVDGDQSMNMLIIEETPAQGVCAVALSNTVVQGTASCQAALNCASTHNEGDPVSSSVADFMGPSLDESQNLEVHMVNSDVPLLNGNQTIVTFVPDAVNSDEVVNLEATVESYKADEHVPEGQVLNKYMVGSLVVDLDTCLNKDGKWKPQDESVKENISLPDESQLIKDDFQALRGNVELEFSECLDRNVTGDRCLDDSSVGQEVEVQEHYTDAEQVDLSGGQEIEMGVQAKLVEDKNSKQTTLKPGSFAKLHQANYLLPPDKEGEFSVSDLVWGKVKSHPWWPGQIFDPADASEKAMKYHRKDCFLVAYFGDRTFAWNEASLLKPFWSNFSQVEKPSNSELFHNAVRCALEEVSRRFELGLTCSCIPKDAYDKIESQIVENSGIRQESSRRYGVDKSTGVSSFVPDKLVEYIRALAQSPSSEAHQLELVIAKAQLLAFNRLKGYFQLPEFQFCGGLLENNAHSSHLGEVIDRAPNDEQDFSSKGRLKTENSSSHKRKHNLKDSVYPRKKERSLSELMGDMASSPEGEDGSDWKASSKSVLSSSGKKRKAVDFISDGSEVQDRRISFYAAKVSTTVSPIPKPSFKVGECIRRVASQLTGSPSILKCSNEKVQKVDGSNDLPVGFDVSLQTPDNSQRGRMVFPMENSSMDEMLSQLYLAAQDPMTGYNFLTAIVTFFAGYRNSVSLSPFSGRQNSSTGKLGGGRKKKASHAIIGYPEEFEFDDVNDSYWTDRIIQNHSEEQPLGDSQTREGEYQLVAFDPDKSLKSSRRPYSRKRFSNGNHKMGIEEPIGYIDERKQDNLPTEVTLSFSEGDSIPTEMKLSKIFRRFGPLKESETVVDLETSRARVVFKRCSDAEVAFSSAGKFNIFGSTIVNYQLSYSPSTSFRTLPLATSQGQEDTT